MILLLLFSFYVHASELWLHVGEVRTLPAPTGKAIRVGSKGVIKVIDGQSSVRVVGLKIGSSPLLIGDQNFLVRVTSGSQKDFTFAAREQMKKLKGLKLEVNAGTLALTGTLLRFSDWLRFAELSRQWQGDYRFRAQALPDVAEEAIAYFSSMSRDRGYPLLRFRTDPDFVAQIPNAAGDLKSAAEAIFKPFGIRVESTDSQLMVQPLVRTRVILAEVSKDLNRELGITWPSTYNAQVLPKFDTSDAVMATLKALESRGQAQILASPNLLCRSGSEAKFHAGGSFPIKIYSHLVHDVIWKEHGVMLKVSPEADFQGSISLAIETEISMLDMANAVEGIPALKSNSVISHFDLPGRRTIALSGLIRQELGESKEGLPYLTGIPILGRLFSSQKFTQHQSEFVIFVTPEIYVPESDEKIELPKGWVRDAI